jgi:hypothetical protein
MLSCLGVFVSPTGVRGVWLRHQLASFKDRLKVLEARVAADPPALVLTKSQVQALEKKKLDGRSLRRDRNRPPGLPGSQDMFYVGTLKGLDRIYQQTFVDTYAKVAFAKLYTTKKSIIAADILNDKVRLFFEQHELPLQRILTDRGTEYCGKAERHNYQLYLAQNDIDHTKTKVKSPQTN